MTYRVHIDGVDLDFPCRGGQNVLECMIGAGKNGIQVGCRGGGCGVCKVEVTQGEFIARPMSKAHVSDEELARRRVLACRITPKSDLTLSVIGKLAKPLQRRCKGQA